MDFYHVARKPLLDSIIELKPISFYTNNSNIELTQIDKEYLLKYHQNGLSSFGEKHLFPLQDELSDKDVENQIEVEGFYEEIRRNYHQDKHSRFSSFFACRTLSDAELLIDNTFRRSCFNQSCNIYKISCLDYQLFDMNLLLSDLSGDDIEKISNDYWSQKTTKKPFYEVLCKPPVKIIKLLK